MLRLILAGVLVFAPLDALAIDRPAPTKTEVAAGIYLFQTAPYGEVGLDGNSIAIVWPDGVLVFDTNGTPAAARAVLAEIRKITEKPVRYIVNSHWHWDHWYGTQVYKEAFPAAQVIAHDATREMMKGPAIEFNRPGVEKQLPAYVEMLEKKAATDPAVHARLETARFFLEEKRSVQPVLPDVTFTSTLDLHLGDRHVQVRHIDRAVTPGDAFLVLPEEHIVISGDLIVNPIPFALSVYPTGWLKTLEAIDAIDASVIVPGHGAPLRDERLLHTTMDVFRILLREGKAAKEKGLDVDVAKDAIMPSLASAKSAITHDDPALDGQFKIYVVDWFLHRVYDELNGPLTNEIAPIPKS
jgi:glyoxylase-like metal-dependent hydrolase (beta-lactamase superfamily II)